MELDIRNREGVERVFRENARSIELVIHTAAQPSHDWAAKDPHIEAILREIYERNEEHWLAGAR